MEANSVEVERGHQGAEPVVEVQGVEHDYPRPFGRNAFQVVTHAAILEEVQPVPDQRGPGDLEPVIVVAKR